VSASMGGSHSSTAQQQHMTTYRHYTHTRNVYVNKNRFSENFGRLASVEFLHVWPKQRKLHGNQLAGYGYCEFCSICILKFCGPMKTTSYSLLMISGWLRYY